jgi:hypothetical protein
VPSSCLDASLCETSPTTIADQGGLLVHATPAPLATTRAPGGGPAHDQLRSCAVRAAARPAQTRPAAGYRIAARPGLLPVTELLPDPAQPLLAGPNWLKVARTSGPPEGLLGLPTLLGPRARGRHRPGRHELPAIGRIRIQICQPRRIPRLRAVTLRPDHHDRAVSAQQAGPDNRAE